MSPFLIGIAFPGPRQANESTGAATARWVFHVLLWMTLFAGLYGVNHWGGLERSLRSPWPGLHRIWLPLFALPLYLTGWLGVGLWGSLRRLPTSAWPEIDAAWADAGRELARAEIDITRTPLFLVLGNMPEALLEAFESQGLASMPRSGSAPFRVFAYSQAIVIACDRLAAGCTTNTAPDTNMLHHLGQLLQATREPNAPVQGVALVTAFNDTQEDGARQRIISGFQQDLDDLRTATGFDVPVFLVVHGVPALSADSPGNAGACWSVRFPPVPDLDPAELGEMFCRGVDWVCESSIRRAARASLRFDESAGSPHVLSQPLRENVRVLQWLATLEAARNGIKDLLVKVTQDHLSEPRLLVGFYLATANPRDGSATGLVRQLTNDLMLHSPILTRTAESFSRETAVRHWAWAGLTLGCLGIMGFLGGFAGLMIAR